MSDKDVRFGTEKVRQHQLVLGARDLDVVVVLTNTGIAGKLDVVASD